MKSDKKNGEKLGEMSHPVRGAWIEIVNAFCNDVVIPSHPVRGAWIEILNTYLKKLTKRRRTP